MTHQSDDEAEIAELIVRHTGAVAARDFDVFSDCWVHSDYSARWNASRVGGIVIRQGWEELANRARQSFVDAHDLLPQGLDYPSFSDLRVRVCGDLGWVTFKRTYAAVPPHRAGPDAYHLRIVERHEGRWKFVFAGFLDPGMGRPDVGHIQLGTDCTVIWADTAAIDRLAGDEDLTVRNGRLRLRDSAANQKLQAAVRWAATLNTGFVPRRGALPIVLEAGEGIPARIWWVVAESGSIYFTFSEKGHEERLDAAAAAYGLSPAQRAVAGHIVAGLAMPEIAKLMSVRPNTVRTHLARIYEKSGVRSQSALVRVLLSASAPR